MKTTMMTTTTTTKTITDEEEVASEVKKNPASFFVVEMHSVDLLEYLSLARNHIGPTD